MNYTQEQKELLLDLLFKGNICLDLNNFIYIYKTF